MIMGKFAFLVPWASWVTNNHGNGSRFHNDLHFPLLECDTRQLVFLINCSVEDGRNNFEMPWMICIERDKGKGHAASPEPVTERPFLSLSYKSLRKEAHIKGVMALMRGRGW